MITKTACVVLSGCGHLDGTEIQEAVLSLYFLSRENIAVQCFAPDMPQMHVINHLNAKPTEETRNVLQESARIARGKIAPLSEAHMDAFDALVLPGGFGAAKNLSTFAINGKDCTVNSDLVRLIGEAHHAKKPIVAICISPAVLAAAMHANGDKGAQLTIGNDKGTADAIEALGATHVTCPAGESRIDVTNRIITTPAYMYNSTPAQVGAGIEATIKQLGQWLHS